MILDMLSSYPNITAALIFLLFSIPISICDMRTMQIPDFLSIILSGILLCQRLIFSRNMFFLYIICAVLSFILFFLVRHISRLGLGWGDIKYSPSCALACGIWCFPAFFAASLFCALYFFIVKNHKNKNTDKKAPFAPFMTLGTLALSSIPIVQELLN
ncbi:MAG: prepilin peptidase [Treponema sp.]|nr:prepilin peptidase [Treponema sp.]